MMQAGHSAISFLLEKFEASRDLEAVIWKNRSTTFQSLLELIEKTRQNLAGIPVGSLVALEAEFSPVSIAALLVLIEKNAVIAPMSRLLPEQVRTDYGALAEVEFIVREQSGQNLTLTSTAAATSTAVLRHAHVEELRRRGRPGLILFSSGSTGAPKAAVHDFSFLLDKFKTPRHQRRMISFLLFDHIGGVNTLFYCLANAGCLITVEDRRPATVMKTIEQFKAEILPTSPTFLKLMLLSRANENRDHSSLKLITYGTEPMPESTLKELHQVFPGVDLLQTYGLSELGILRSQSRSPDSLWVKIGGDGFQTRVVDGLLEIKAASSMLGYLNAESPFTADGWFKTGDVVKVDGPWLQILGRRSELINVGGEKVFPAEVESVLQEMEGVLSAVVSGEPNALLGHIIKASVQLGKEETLSHFRARMRLFCKDRLAPFKIPQLVEFAKHELHSIRYKKNRT
jgi:long-chain acyl-CoA synthetase